MPKKIKNSQKEKFAIKTGSKLSDLFRANPHTDYGKKIAKEVLPDLEHNDFEKIFFNYLYSDPYFDHSENKTSENINELNKLKEEKKCFIKLLNNDSEFPLLFIRGSAGSGKSTFLFKTMFDYKNESNKRKYNHIKYNIEHPIYALRIEKEYTICNNHNLSDALKEFEFLVFYQIVEFVSKLIDNDDDENIIKRSNFSKNYTVFCSDFNDYVSSTQKEILEWIGLFCKESSEKNKNELKKLAIFNIHKLRSEDDIYISISNLLELTVMALYCTFSVNDNDENKEYYFLCFDGIEHFININSKSYPLYCVDVEEIVRSIYQFSQNITNEISVLSKSNIDFNNWFKIIITLRDTTERYLPREIYNLQNFNPSSVDVTQWYRFNDIFKKKLLYFRDTIKVKDKLLSLIDIIISDKAGIQPGNSIIEMLEKMYNSDKRNLITSLIEALEVIYTKRTGVNPVGFIQLWDEKEGSRYLFRQAIIRLILNKIRDIRISEDYNQGLLYEMYFLNTKDHNHIANKYARKIILFLMSQLYDGTKIKNEYVSFKSLVNGVFTEQQQGAWKQGEKNETTRAFARVLFLMGNYKLLNSYWQQLVVIKFNGVTTDETFDERNLEKKLIECYKNSYNEEDFGVKITYSGCFLADIQPDFEFFACRIKNKHYSEFPLILSDDTNYICSVIKYVYIDCVKCIRSIVESEHISFTKFSDMYRKEGCLYVSDYRVENKQKQTHPYRIIESHINYLNEYKHCINLDKGRKNKIFTRIDTEKIISTVNEYLGYYRNLITQLREGYGGEKDIREIDGENIFYNLAADDDGSPHLKDRHGIPYGFDPYK